jgi:hypothetical protein
MWFVSGSGVAVLIAGLLLIGEPALADAQLASDNRALTQASKHQIAIDTALQQFLTPGPSGGGEADDQLLKRSSQNVAEYEAARNLVSSDLTSLQSALHPSWIVAAAWSKGDDLQQARLRTATAVVALQHANQVLTAAIDQEHLQQGFFFAVVTETKMLTDIDDQQYVPIDGLYAQANQALRVSERLMGKSDVSPGYKPAIVAMRSILNETQQYAAALLRNDQAAATADHAVMREGYLALAQATNDATVSANNDWNDRTFQPLVAAYHSGLAAILS